jgi:hypothetical protein
LPSLPAARVWCCENCQRPSRLDKLKPDFGTPLPQRAFDGIGFKRIPVLENAFTLQQILETRIRPLPPERTLDLVVTCWQRLSDKAQGETSSEIELVLVRYGNVPI